MYFWGKYAIQLDRFFLKEGGLAGLAPFSLTEGSLLSPLAYKVFFTTRNV